MNKPDLLHRGVLYGRLPGPRKDVSRSTSCVQLVIGGPSILTSYSLVNKNRGGGFCCHSVLEVADN